MKLGLIGCGKMGRSLLEGALQAGQANPQDCTVHNRSEQALQSIVADLGVHSAETASAVASCSDVILLCTKPNDMLDMLRTISADAAKAPLYISVAAGLSISQLESALPAGSRVIRCMPNTPALIGQGAAAYTRGTHASTEDATTAQSLLSSTGLASEVYEHLLDAVTGLSGSGPAYVYTFIEALADGGVAEGLPRNIALELAVQTVKGAATMVAETGHHPAVLRDMVTSPGGTTIAALASLENDGFRAAAINAVRSSAARSRELGA